MVLKRMCAAALLMLLGATSLPSAVAQDVHQLGGGCFEGHHLSGLRFTITTGDDDLRGGHDNVMAYIRVAGHADWGLIPLHGGLNGSVRWADRSTHTVDVPLDYHGCAPPPAYITGVRLQTTFGGGMGGDNWNLQAVHVDWVGTDDRGAPASGPLADAPASARGGYVHRFNGDNIPFDVPMLPPTR
jgi:hypothetical protein